MSILNSESFCVSWKQNIEHRISGQFTNVADIGSSRVLESASAVGTNMSPLMLSISVAGKLVYSGPDIA